MKKGNLRLLELLCILISVFPCVLFAETIRIAAASDLQYVLPALIKTFEQQSHHQVKTSFAASGNLVSQIRHGAPYDIFFSANLLYVKTLQKQSLTKGQAIPYAQGSLALFVPEGASVSVDKNLAGLRTAIKNHQIDKIALANPAHAPYGQAAKAILQQKGLWQEVQPFLLLAENASQVVQFTLISGVDAGFIPYGHAIQKAIASRGQRVKLDQQLQQYAILLHHSHPAAKVFLDFIQTPQAKRILVQYGYFVSGRQ